MSRVKFFSDMSLEDKSNAISGFRYTDDCGDILAVIDNTFLGSCRDGFMLTAETIILREAFSTPVRYKNSEVHNISCVGNVLKINGVAVYKFQMPDEDEVESFFEELVSAAEGEDRQVDDESIDSSLQMEVFREYFSLEDDLGYGQDNLRSHLFQKSVRGFNKDILSEVIQFVIDRGRVESERLAEVCLIVNLLIKKIVSGTVADAIPLELIRLDLSQSERQRVLFDLSESGIRDFISPMPVLMDMLKVDSLIGSGIFAIQKMNIRQVLEHSEGDIGKITEYLELQIESDGVFSSASDSQDVVRDALREFPFCLKKINDKYLSRCFEICKNFIAASAANIEERDVDGIRFFEKMFCRLTDLELEKKIQNGKMVEKITAFAMLKSRRSN